MKVNKAVFPLAGEALRMFPVSKYISKEMFNIYDKPLLYYSILEVLNSGIRNLIFVIKKQKKNIENFFNFNNYFNNERVLSTKMVKLNSFFSKIDTITYITQNKSLGLGHAIWCTKNAVGNEPFAVLLPDDFIESRRLLIGRMVSCYEKVKNSIIAFSEVESNDIKNYGILETNFSEPYQMFRITNFIEKPFMRETSSNLAIVGRYILTPDIFKYIEKSVLKNENEINLTNCMKKMLNYKSIYGYYYDGLRFDCGNFKGLRCANLYFN